MNCFVASRVCLQRQCAHCDDADRSSDRIEALRNKYVREFGMLYFNVFLLVVAIRSLVGRRHGDSRAAALSGERAAVTHAQKSHKWVVRRP
jgi:hypothetical protein